MFKKLIAKLKKNKDKEKQKPQLTDKELKEIREFETEFLKKNKNEIYNFFGYILDDGPLFITKPTNSNRFGDSVHVFTPKMLTHCVTHLTRYWKHHESLHVDNFIDKCNDIAKNSTYNEESWEKTIRKLVKYIKPYAKKLNNEI